MDRRRFVHTLAAAATAGTGACSDTSEPGYYSGRLLSRPGPVQASIVPGLWDIRYQGELRAQLSVPPAYDPAHPAALLVAFHGAGGGLQSLASFRPETDSRGILLLLVGSYGVTWDGITGSYGADAEVIDYALEYAFYHCAVDPGRLAFGGFSDGATYALGLGLTNSDFVSRIIAFSPGYVPSHTLRGQPRVFVSHGTNDLVLPIDQASRQIVPGLRSQGLDVTYQEFDGGHTVPADIRTQALEWLRT